MILQRSTRPLISRLAALLLCISILQPGGDAAAQNAPAIRVDNQGVSEDELGRVFEDLDPSRIPTGLLIDQVAVLIDPSALDGTPAAPSGRLDEWRQIFHQFSRSGTRHGATPHPRGGRAAEGLPSIEQLNRVAEEYLDRGLTPLGIMHVSFNRIAADALTRGLVRLENGRLRDAASRRESSYTAQRTFAVAVFDAKATTRSVRFVIPPELNISYGAPRSSRLSIDFGDGRGFQTVRAGEVVPVTYDTGGTKQIAVEAESGGETYIATTTMEVSATAVPAPDLVWSNQTATRAYAGGFASYDAYFYYGAGNTAPTRPVVFVEGFDPYYNDPAKRRTHEDIYEILLQQDFIARLRALGYDAVVMKLHNAADYVQRNAYALEHLLGRLNTAIPAEEQMVVAGPSMGGLIGRYALASMESRGLSHNVRLFASLDSPQQAANFPLGVQFFLEFNDGDSELAAQGKAAVNSVAARQMLAYQYRSFPKEDGLRTRLMNELDAYGYPSIRKIAIANGSGTGQSQLGNERVNFREMVPGDKIVEYRYRSLFVDLDGDVWALPDYSPETRIFEGRKDVFGPHYRAQNVYVSGTLPYDNAPGGSRATQQEIADGDVTYGDIKTAFPDHSWIPTISALDLQAPDLTYNVAVDAAGLTTKSSTGKRSSPHFDAIYFPPENEPHIFATAENVDFLLDEIDTFFPASRTIAGHRTFNSGQHIVVGEGATITFAGDVSIAPGVRFSLGRGAVLLFKDRVEARGTPVERIRFERSGGAAWNHLDLHADGNLFEHVELEGGTKTVEIRSRDNTFRHCVFTNGWRGVSSNYARSGGRSSFTLENSVVAANSSVGVVAYHSNPQIKFTTIRDNAQAGLWAYDASIDVFHRSVVTNNALTQTSRSGVEIMTGGYIGFVGPGFGRGYSRVANNTSHEIFVARNASGAILGSFGYGGYNAVFDLDEGGAAATEMLIRNTNYESVYANETYWGGISPDADDVSGSVFIGTVLYTDPTGGTKTLSSPLLATHSIEEPNPAYGSPGMRLTTVQSETTGDNAVQLAASPAGDPGDMAVQLAAGSAGDSGDMAEQLAAGPAGDPGALRRRIVEIRRSLQQNPPDHNSAGALRELFLLQHLDPEDRLGERESNRTVFAQWRARLSSKSNRPARARAEVQQSAEVAALLEIRGALLEERYADATALIDHALPLFESAEGRQTLLLERVSVLEHEGRFADALSALGEATAHLEDETRELYSIVRESLMERLAPQDDLLASAGIASLHPVDRSQQPLRERAGFTLNAAHPNPFNPETVIPFSLEGEAHVRIEVHDVLGRRVAILADGRYGAGRHEARFEAQHLPSGLYFVGARVRSDDGSKMALSQSVLLLK